MFNRLRHRRGPYALAEPTAFPRALKALIWLLILGAILFYMGKGVVSLFSNNELQRKAVTLVVERGGVVNVSIEGGLLKRTDTSVPLYGGDKVSTGSNGHGTLQFFDGTKVRLDEQTEVTVNESVRGAEESTIDLSLTRGALWIETPTATVFSGAIARVIDTPMMAMTVPAGTEALIAEGGMTVFSADGLGLPVTVKNTKSTITIGEGQKFSAPANPKEGEDLYAYRAALEPSSFSLAFVQGSRGALSANILAQTGSGTVAPNTILTITSPVESTSTAEGKVLIKGTVSNAVAKVRINGYIVDLNQGVFSQEVVLDQESVDILVEALNAQDSLIASAQRTVKRAATAAVKPPAITSPAKDGQLYRTLSDEIVLRGTVPPNTLGVIVNDYRLQLFDPDKGTWSYLASNRLGNLKAGTNVFDVYALDANGNKSEPVRLTILQEEGIEGVVSSAAAATSSAGSTPTVIDETTLPQNAPLEAGTLQVTGPTAGLSHTATGSEFVIVGTTSPNTASVWVNGYQLQLYKAGKTTWNYIASEELKTLKKGANTYRVVARDKEQKIVDAVTYTVNY